VKDKAYIPAGIDPDLIDNFKDLINVHRDFDSYMIPTDELVLGSTRLLEVTQRLNLPVFEFIRILVTSDDVIHS